MSKKMTEAELEKAIATKLDCSESQANEFVNALKQVLIEEVPAHGGFQLTGVLSAIVKLRKARVGRNPSTGARIDIPAKNYLKFNLGVNLEKAIQ